MHLLMTCASVSVGGDCTLEAEDEAMEARTITVWCTSTQVRNAPSSYIRLLIVMAQLMLKAFDLILLASQIHFLNN